MCLQMEVNHFKVNYQRLLQIPHKTENMCHRHPFKFNLKVRKRLWIISGQLCPTSPQRQRWWEGKETKQSHHLSPHCSLLMLQRWAECCPQHHSWGFYFGFTAYSSTDFHQQNKPDMNACTETQTLYDREAEGIYFPSDTSQISPVGLATKCFYLCSYRHLHIYFLPGVSCSPFNPVHTDCSSPSLLSVKRTVFNTDSSTSAF